MKVNVTTVKNRKESDWDAGDDGKLTRRKGKVVGGIKCGKLRSLVPATAM